MKMVPVRDGQMRNQTESNLRERTTTGQCNVEMGEDLCLSANPYFASCFNLARNLGHQEVPDIFAS